MFCGPGVKSPVFSCVLLAEGGGGREGSYVIALFVFQRESWGFSELDSVNWGKQTQLFDPSERGGLMGVREKILCSFDEEITSFLKERGKEIEFRQIRVMYLNTSLTIHMYLYLYRRDF